LKCAACGIQEIVAAKPEVVSEKSTKEFIKDKIRTVLQYLIYLYLKPFVFTRSRFGKLTTYQYLCNLLNKVTLEMSKKLAKGETFVQT
jgi:hypothetical protein